MKKSYLIGMVLSLSIALIVLFLLLPKHPPLDEELRLKQAVNIVNSGPMNSMETPMVGIGILKEIVEKNPSNEKALFQLGKFANQSGQYEKAIEWFNKVISVNSNNLAAWVLKGECELNMGKTKEALVSFESALKIDSTETNALFYSGRIYEFEGNLIGARDRYEQFLRMNKEESEIQDSVKVFVKRIDKKLNNK